MYPFYPYERSNIFLFDSGSHTYYFRRYILCNLSGELESKSQESPSQESRLETTVIFDKSFSCTPRDPTYGKQRNQVLFGVQGCCHGSGIFSKNFYTTYLLRFKRSVVYLYNGCTLCVTCVRSGSSSTDAPHHGRSSGGFPEVTYDDQGCLGQINVGESKFHDEIRRVVPSVTVAGDTRGKSGTELRGFRVHDGPTPQSIAKEKIPYSPYCYLGVCVINDPHVLYYGHFIVRWCLFHISFSTITVITLYDQFSCLRPRSNNASLGPRR